VDGGYEEGRWIEDVRMGGGWRIWDGRLMEDVRMGGGWNWLRIVSSGGF
jgi:hypothetical protein